MTTTAAPVGGNDTGKTDSGCGSVIGVSAAAAAFVFKKKDETA